MRNRFLMSVAAAALIAGTGFANAQGTGTSREAPSTGATTQQSAPPSAATPMNRDSSQSGAPAEAPKAAQSKDMAPKGEKSAQDNMKGPASKDMKADSKSGNRIVSGADSKASTSGTDAKQNDRQRCHLGDRRTTGRKAHPDRFCHQVGENPGNDQCKLQYLGGRDYSGVGPFPSASAPDRGNLSGVARL